MNRFEYFYTFERKFNHQWLKLTAVDFNRKFLEKSHGYGLKDPLCRNISAIRKRLYQTRSPI